VLQREGLLCREGVVVVVIKRRRERERERDFIKNIGNGAKEFVIVQSRKEVSSRERFVCGWCRGVARGRTGDWVGG
jgi:hypothetical protein